VIIIGSFIVRIRIISLVSFIGSISSIVLFSWVHRVSLICLFVRLNSLGMGDFRGGDYITVFMSVHVMFVFLLHVLLLFLFQQ